MVSALSPAPAMLARIKAAAIVKMSRMGIIQSTEAVELRAAHVDDVLDRLFHHCGIIRVRVADDRFIEIHPKRTIH